MTPEKPRSLPWGCKERDEDPQLTLFLGQMKLMLQDGGTNDKKKRLISLHHKFFLAPWFLSLSEIQASWKGILSVSVYML